MTNNKNIDIIKKEVRDSMDTVCKISKQCGSCNYMGMNYQKQCQIKTDFCKQLVSSSKVSDIKVEKIQGLENYFGYRNKVIVAFNEKYEYGLYEENSHRIIPYQRCLLHDEESDLIIQKIQAMLKRYHVRIYDKKRRKGLLRHVLIRRAVETNQTMVVLICNEDVFPGSKNFCRELVDTFKSIKTIVLNVNKRDTSIVLGEDKKILYGKGFIVDRLCGLKFKISARSFYQINHQQCKNLYLKAISLLNLKKNDIVIDAYCGIGTIGMLVSNHVRHVIGVELNKDAIKDAIYNAKMNHISNIDFICQDASLFMKQLSKTKQHIDAIIMDPPRSGSTKEFMDAIACLKPKQVVYISCDPVSQIRDLEYFKKIGYHASKMYPFDMFPLTRHIESIVVLSRGKIIKNKR